MGSRLGRYLVLKHLASGGMADVLLGRSDGIEGFERHVVLKRIRPEHARDQRFIRMFLDEARVAANLHHQHIVQVHDIGEAEGEYFIAMEYIHGEDVRTILSNASKTRAHVPLGHAIAIVSAASAGLHYAHERRGSDKRPLGIVHRDISPSNILVGYDGSIKILDFGIAKASMRQETRSGSLKGKISYMSPEQCKGTEVDRRSDVYSLGVVLYELTTTTRLFKGDNDYLVMDQIVNGRVSLPQVRRPDLPNELSAIIMRAIAPDPERRYFTADELRVALDQFAAKAGMAASTSAIGAYLRKQFGERPEPWLELEAQGIYSFDDLQVAVDESAPSHSWTELPRGDDQFRRSSSSIPRQSGSISALSGGGASDAPAMGRQQSQRIASPPPTDSKMGWESQRPAPRGFTPAKLAMISAPLIVILAVAVWRLAGTGSTESAASATPAPAAQAAPAPVVTPIPEPPPPPPPAVVAETRAAADKEPESPSESASPTTRSRSSTSSPKRSQMKTTDVAAPAPAVAAAPGPAPAPAPASASSTKSKTSPSSGAPLGVAPPVTGSGSPAPASGPAMTAGTAPAPQGSAAPPAPAETPPVIAAPPVVAAAPLPAAVQQQNVASTALDANRIAGDKDIMPDTTTQTEIARAGVERIVGTYKLCVAADGSIGAVTPIKSSGYPMYDVKIQNTIRTRWRYRPFMVNGKPTPVCTAVRFTYSQK